MPRRTWWFSRWTLAVALFAALTVSSYAPAQDDPPTQADAASEAVPMDEDQLDDVGLLDLEVPIIVTATRREQKITHVPYAVSVITAEDIRRSGARSVPDALRLVPGVDVADLSFRNYAVAPRGFHGFLSRQVLVLVDGRQVFDSHFGGTLWGTWPFQLEDIDRIEVIRGPGGVTWGANAVNGVINVITKDPGDQLGFTLTAGGGSRGTFKKHIAYGFRDEKLRLRISGEYEASDGFRKGGSFLRNLEDDYKCGRVGIHATHAIEPNDTVVFSAGSAILDGGFPPMPLAGIGLRRNSEAQASFLMGKWTHKVAEDNWYELTGYVNDFQGSAGVPSMDYRYQQIALQLSHNFKLGPEHTVTWGVDTRADLLDGTNSDPFMFSKGFISTGIIGFYLQDEWHLGPSWTLDMGGRIDYEFYGGFQPSARVALSHRLSDESMLFGAVSRAFQMPPAGLRFIDMPITNGLVRVTGHRSVDAETLIAYELGYRGSFLDRLDTNLNLFWHEFDDLTTLSPIPGPPGLIRMDIENRAAASIYGIEWDAGCQVTERLTLSGHYTYQQLDWRSSAPFHEKELVTPPENKFMFGVHYSPTDDVHLSSHLYYVDAVKAPNPANPFFPRHVDSYFRLDLRGEYEFCNDDASIALGVRNLLDSNHYEGGTLFLNDAEVPRMVYAEFRMAIR